MILPAVPLRRSIDEATAEIAADAIEDVPGTPAELDDALPDDGEAAPLESALSDTPLAPYLD